MSRWRKLTSRQHDILVSALSIAAADKHNLDWLNRVLAGTRSKVKASESEVIEVWRVLNSAQTVEVTGEFKP